jgi:hypothetical protein
MPIFQLSDDPRTWTADNAAALINAVLGQAAPPANDITAFMVQRPARPAGTLIRVDSPENWLEDALKLRAITIVNPPGSDGLKDEWKECRATIGRFDGLLVDLRKTGFGFVTAIVSGATFFFVYDPTKPLPERGKFAVFTIIMVLTLTLYLIDRVHQIMTQQAVDLACSLEVKIGFSISRVLGSIYTRKHSTILEMGVYWVLLFAVYLASLFSSDAASLGSFQAWWRSVYEPLMLLELIVGVGIIEVVVRKTRIQ